MNDWTTTTHRDLLLNLQGTDGTTHYIRASLIARWKVTPRIEMKSATTPVRTHAIDRDGRVLVSVDGDISAALADACGFKKGEGT